MERVPVGIVSALEFVLLAPAALLLVLVAVPRSVGIESSCVGPFGAVATEGDTYVAGFVALGTLGWFGVLVGVIFAAIAERRALVLILPAAWFVALVGASLVVAAALGATPCPS
jgi:hypothetical protein